MKKQRFYQIISYVLVAVLLATPITQALPAIQSVDEPEPQMVTDGGDPNLGIQSGVSHEVPPDATPPQP